MQNDGWSLFDLIKSGEIPFESSHSELSQQYLQRIRVFMDSYILSRNTLWHTEVAAGIYPVSFMGDLKALAKSAGLWNLFLPALGDEELGEGLSTLDYAPLAEVMGRIAWSAKVFNCSAPDTGNMELLHMFATSKQRRACWF